MDGIHIVKHEISGEIIMFDTEQTPEMMKELAKDERSHLFIDSETLSDMQDQVQDLIDEDDELDEDEDEEKETP